VSGRSLTVVIDLPGEGVVMRSIYWLFVISVLLFVSGIGFVVIASRTARAAPVTDEPVLAPVASVKQIMNGIVGPAANVVYQAVTTTMTATGTEERAPRTDHEWQVVEGSAAALIESGNLLMIGSRAVDRADWITMSKAMIDAGTVALKAARARNAGDLFGSGEGINNSCDTCHQKYQRGS
jgi:hypothetical protein